MDPVKKYFEFEKHGTNFRTEIIAGLTTFLAMAYILIVNPLFLSGAVTSDFLDADVRAALYPEFGAVFTATAIAAMIGTLIMGILARYPIAQAPGMGLNAFFTFTVVLTMGVPWEFALAGVFISGFVFFILTLTKIRETIINAIPQGLKYAVGAGIGLFIAFIGLKNAGIVVADPGTLVGLGDLRPENIAEAYPTYLAIFGLVVTAILMVRKVRGAIFIGMVISVVVAMIFGLISRPEGIVSAPPSMAPTFGAALEALFSVEFWTHPAIWVVVFTFLFIDFFDTAGTLVAVAGQAKLLDKNGKLPRAGRALSADSIASMGGAVLGTSTTTSYIESSAGVAEGGRTGFTAIVVALLFGLSVFFFPILVAIEPLAGAITAPALVIVGVLMAGSLARIAWDKVEEAIPGFLTVIMMPLTFSIATGIAIGFLVYPITMIARGKWKEVHPVMYVLFFVFILYFVYLGE